MSQRDEEAARVGSLLGIRYTHALRLIREVRKDMGDEVPFTDLAHGCRAIKEKEEAEPKPKPKRKRGVLPKGAGGVRCIPCGAYAAADGEGSPIVLKHDDDCPEKYPVKDHRYDAGWPRDDIKWCIASIGNDSNGDPIACERPLSEHAHSEYPEDGR